MRTILGKKAIIDLAMLPGRQRGSMMGYLLGGWFGNGRIYFMGSPPASLCVLS